MAPPPHPSASQVELPAHGRLLAVDWGTVRIGVAMTDEHQLLATPLTTLIRRRGKRFPLRRLIAIIEAHHPVGVVVGLPLSADGTDTPTSDAVRQLAQRLERHAGIPVTLWDERMSTARAITAIKETGGRRPEQRQQIDAMAAAVLLEHYLAWRRGEP